MADKVKAEDIERALGVLKLMRRVGVEITGHVDAVPVMQVKFWGRAPEWLSHVDLWKAVDHALKGTKK